MVANKLSFVALNALFFSFANRPYSARFQADIYFYYFFMHSRLGEEDYHNNINNLFDVSYD